MIETIPLRAACPAPEHAAGHHHGPVISESWKWTTVIGNGVIGAAEMAVGGLTSVLSVATDGVHNAADTFTYWLQSKNILDRGLTDAQRQRNRKIANWVIAATSLGFAAKAGTDLALDHDTERNVLNVYVAGASLALNTLMFAGLRRGIQRRKRQNGNAELSHAEEDLKKHFLFSDMPSAALALVGATAHKYGVTDLEQTAAMASGVLSAYVFRPTKANLRHNHSHFGEQEAASHTDHIHEPIPRQAKKRMPRRRLRAVLAGFMAITLAGGLAASGQSDDTAERPGLQQPAAVQPESLPSSEELLPPRPVTECVTVAYGDSQWRLAERRIKEVTGQRADSAVTHEITRITSLENRETNPNPHLIYPGQCLRMPTAGIIAAIHGELTAKVAR
jgi:hypothetical protein